MSKSVEQQEEEIYNRLKQMFPCEHHMLEALATAIGMSAVMTQFLADIFEDNDNALPNMVKYAMAVTAGNMYALTSVSPLAHVEKIKFPLIEQLTNEQTEEYLRRKMIAAIEFLYASIQENLRNG